MKRDESRMPVGPEPALLDRKFSSDDVCRMARITARQLQWWDERNVVSPDQKAHRRVYVAEDVIAIMVIAELRRKRVSLQKVRSLAGTLQRTIRHHLVECIAAPSGLHLLTNGTSVRLEQRPARIIELMKQSCEPMFVVSVSDQVKRMASFQRGSRKGAGSGSQRQLPLF